MTATGTDWANPVSILGTLVISATLASSALAQAPAVRTAPPKATGVYPVTTENSLVIRGIPGQIVVMAKPTRELRFGSRAKDKSGGERPVTVSIDGPTVTLAPPPDGVAFPDGILRVDAPASFSVRIEAHGGTVLVDGFAGTVALAGKATILRAQALSGKLEADAEAGTVTLTELGGAVDAKISAGCALTATNVKGGIELKSQDSTFKMQGVGGPCRVDARGGSGELAGLTAGGDLRLSESGLKLTGGRGELVVTSDAAVEFSNMSASMRFDMDGGTLKGKGNQGPVEVRARHTEITLETIAGALRVEGEDTKTKLIGITGELNVDVSRGNVLIQRVVGPVTAVVFGGDAQLVEVQGSVRLDLQGGNADVSWSAVTGENDSLLENKTGNITARFPPTAACRVTAKTRSGHVTSDIPTIKVPPNTTEAQGALGQSQRPLIEIEAEGNVHLSTAAKAAAAPSQ